MSAGITVRCDRTGQYGSCPAQLLTDTTDLAEAHAAAERRGWATGGPYYCPRHSGRPATTAAVVPLHLRENR
ncbi:hypothetical protein [Streptomyces sp. NPDC058612]|uniref:hypothetical protein n=1 Tax=Streptomyces sp. NPDC058612 TaxID=3346555 RepID=UPI0036677278